MCFVQVVNLKLFCQFCKSKQKQFYVRTLYKLRKSRKNHHIFFFLIEETMVLTRTIFLAVIVYFRVKTWFLRHTIWQFSFSIHYPLNVFLVKNKKYTFIISGQYYSKPVIVNFNGSSVLKRGFKLSKGPSI